MEYKRSELKAVSKMNFCCFVLIEQVIMAAIVQLLV